MDARQAWQSGSGCAYLRIGASSGSSAVVVMAILGGIVCLRVVVDIVLVDREVATPAFAWRRLGSHLVCLLKMFVCYEMRKTVKTSGFDVEVFVRSERERDKAL